jgi:hypothetical protein
MPAGWVAAAGAVVSAGESVASNQAAKSANAKNNANNAVLSGAQNTMLNDAQSIANQPYTPYSGTLTAPMSGNEQQGYSMASSVANSGVAQGDNAAAVGQINAVANNPWNANTAKTYMNPYTQQVTDNAISNQNKSYLESLSGLKEQGAGSDAFGGGRNAIAESNLAATNNQNIGTLTAQSDANAYNTAFSQWQGDNNMKLAAAKSYEDAGQDVTNMNSTQIADLMKTGGVAQVISQTDLSNQYGQFLRQQGWSANQLQSLIGAVGSDKGSPAQTAPIQSNIGNQLLGLGSTVAGLYGGGTSSAGSVYGSGAPTSADISGDTAGATTGANDLSNTTIDPGATPTADIPVDAGG